MRVLGIILFIVFAAAIVGAILHDLRSTKPADSKRS